MKNKIIITFSTKGDNKKQFWREVLGSIVSGSVITLLGLIISICLK